MGEIHEIKPKQTTGSGGGIIACVTQSFGPICVEPLTFSISM